MNKENGMQFIKDNILTLLLSLVVTLLVSLTTVTYNGIDGRMARMEGTMEAMAKELKADSVRMATMYTQVSKIAARNDMALQIALRDIGKATDIAESNEKILIAMK